MSKLLSFDIHNAVASLPVLIVSTGVYPSGVYSSGVYPLVVY